VLIQYIEYILENYEKDKRINTIVTSIHSYFLLSANPDGYKNCKRENTRGVDLNRNLYYLILSLFT
jgi:murein tripeptide amidase MpaA